MSLAHAVHLAVSKQELTIYVEVDTAFKLPLLMLMASAITEPMKEPNWKMAQNTPNAFPLSFSNG